MKEKIQELQKLLDEKTKKLIDTEKGMQGKSQEKALQLKLLDKKKLLENLGIRKFNMKHEVAKKLVFHDVFGIKFENNLCKTT